MLLVKPQTATVLTGLVLELPSAGLGSMWPPGE